MIESKKINVIIGIAVCFALIMTTLIIGFGNSDAAKIARQAKYVTELFGDEVISINIIADGNDWNQMIANASAKEYIMTDVVVNGIKFQGVGVRTKGNASLSQVSSTSSPKRYSLHIKFNKYLKKQTCFGLDELILNNMISDSTYMKEYMSQDIMHYIGVEAPLTNYADISVNGEHFGFYVALESYGTSYIKRVYEDKTGNFYNVKTMQMGGDPGGFGGQKQDDNQNLQGNAPDTNDWGDRAGFVGKGGGSTGGSLQYTDDNISSYSAIFDNAIKTVSKADQRKVIKALKNLSTGTDLETYFDVDEILRYFAAHTVVVNLDSYYSNMAQNYFLYERNGQISILPWDYHLSYGAFQAGTASDVINYPIDTPVSGVTMESRPLLNVLLSNDDYLARYHQYLQELVDGYFKSGLFEETVHNLQNKIVDYVRNDSSAFYTYEQFETGVNTLIQLNLLRAESIEGQLDETIPSTTDGQKADSFALIDASSINMSDLGSNGMGGGMGNRPGNNQGNFPSGVQDVNGQDKLPNGQEGQNRPGWNNPFGEAMPDMAVIQQAMKFIQDADGEITDEVKSQLLELGLTDEQITLISKMLDNPEQSSFFENRPGGGKSFDKEAPNMQREKSSISKAVNESSNQINWSYIFLIGVLTFVLMGVTVFVIKLKRNY